MLFIGNKHVTIYFVWHLYDDLWWFIIIIIFIIIITFIRTRTFPISQAEKDASRQKYPFELVTKHREYLLAAETSEERALWCNILMLAITQYKVSNMRMIAVHR